MSFNFSNLLNSISTSNLPSATITQLTNFITGTASNAELALGRGLNAYAAAFSSGNKALMQNLEVTLLAIQGLPTNEGLDLQQVFGATTQEGLNAAITQAKKDANLQQ
jgi:hypothetical protein